MKKFNFLFCLTVFSLFILASCKKDKDEDPSTPLSIVGKWKQSSGTYNPAYFGTTDYFADYEACEKDDIIEFKSDNTFEINEGATKCDPSDPQVLFTDNYSYNAATKTLTIDGQSIVIELTATTLTVNDEFEDNGVTYTDHSTYTRQ